MAIRAQHTGVVTSLTTEFKLKQTINHTNTSRNQTLFLNKKKCSTLPPKDRNSDVDPDTKDLDTGYESACDLLKIRNDLSLSYTFKK